uniref:Uncharacterized protein n=1 Tax=Anguilla anguilla TaxID=7936 RepID=A0A0E9Q0N2_ANGAN
MSPLLFSGIRFQKTFHKR